MKRKLMVVLLAYLGTGIVVYVVRRRRWNATWGQVPRNEWEQAEALLRDGRAPETPLDALQVLADVTEWLKQ